jgi:hypothetical protein
MINKINKIPNLPYPYSGLSKEWPPLFIFNYSLNHFFNLYSDAPFLVVSIP